MKTHRVFHKGRWEIRSFARLACVAWCFLAAVAPAGAQAPNLLPNGDVEDEFVNHIRVGEKRTTTMEAWHSGEPTFWKRGPGASLDRETVHSGRHSIKLHADETTAEATAYSDYWRVKDSTMPFGLPLVPGRPVEIAFHVKTSPTLAVGSVSAEIRLGTIDSLPSDSQTVTLGPETEWKRVALTMTPEALRWGVSITFRAAGNFGDGQTAWIDDISVTQDLGELLNLVHNPGFEQAMPGSPWPVDWDAPMDDQWVSWVGNEFRAPTFSPASYSGARAMRCTVTYAEVSGLSQVVQLNQDVIRPIAIGLWTKLDNSIGNSMAGGGYYGSDNLPNLTVFVYHQDGTMQEVSPTFCLGESDHDWDYLRGGFMPQKPVARLRIQATVLGTEPTTSLWLDNAEVFELDGNGTSHPSANFAPNQTLYSAWGDLGESTADQLQAAMNDEGLSLFIPRAPEDGDHRVYLNPLAWAPMGTHQRYLFKVVRLQESGQIAIADAVEKQGLIAEGIFSDGATVGIGMNTKLGGGTFFVPWRALGLDGPPAYPIGFNIQQRGSDGDRFWTGKSAATSDMGVLVPPTPRGIAIQSVRFGNRYEHETDQTRDPVSQPPMYAGMNDGAVWISNSGPAAEITLSAGVRGRANVELPLSIGAGETKRADFAYDAGSGTSSFFDIALHQGGETLLEDTYPLVSPEAMELVPDQEYYFPEEAEATVEVHARYRPLPLKGRAEVVVRDLQDNRVVSSLKHEIHAPVSTFRVPLDTLRVNATPVQDYRLEVTWFDDHDNQIGTQTTRFGRINHTIRHPLPAVESVAIDETGRLMINGDFPFFPVVPSLSNEAWDAGINLGGNIYRPIYAPGSDNPEFMTSVVTAADRAWSKNAYLMPIGPGPGQVEPFEKEVPTIFAHPGFLGAYPKQFYYWNLDDALVAYRNQMETLFAAQSSKRLLVWGHHDSSFLYDHDVTWPDVHPAVGYCYVHIMGRPGSGWRNAPFLTRTEQILDPSRFKLAEVNLYVTWHDDEIVPEHFKTYYSLRADSIAGFRNESYLAVIYGANGLYHYICTQTGGLQRLRGWFQELNYMWPVFAAEDSKVSVTVEPADSGVETRLKSYNGHLYLLTANASEKITQAMVTIHGLDGMAVKKLFDLPGSLTIEGDRLHDVWGAQDAHVYEISAP